MYADDARLETTRDIARRLNVSPRTIARWVEIGVLVPEVTTPGGQYRFKWEDVQAQLRASRER
jgi:excisionase family DNA binding protein